jgi:hypothetical protein
MSPNAAQGNQVAPSDVRPTLAQCLKSIPTGPIGVLAMAIGHQMS